MTHYNALSAMKAAIERAGRVDKESIIDALEGLVIKSPTGTVTIRKIAADSDGLQKKLLFTPGRLTVGIEPSDDPLITARDGSYAESFKRRSAHPYAADK